mmetsp:Transcript_28582/g.64482  ORF Transcript_28582/g.64482 Transcript_28582/m.64482 type:complete len:142 (+) Transcript_28582:1910-2335(+)
MASSRFGKKLDFVVGHQSSDDKDASRVCSLPREFADVLWKNLSLRFSNPFNVQLFHSKSILNLHHLRLNPKMNPTVSYMYHVSLSIQLIEEFHSVQDLSFACLLDFAGQHVFVQNHINLVKVENNVQLAHIVEIRIQQLDE